MLADQGSIRQDTLQSQDGLNLGMFAFVPYDEPSTCSASLLTVCRNSSPRAHSCPPAPLEGTPELSGTTAILLVFQADGQNERITDVYMGLIVHRVKSRLYTLDQILDFIKEIDLKAVCDTLKAGGDPGKRCTFCLFVSNYGGTMSIPMDPPYYLIYPMSYMRDIEPDHFDTHNNPARTHLCHCTCRATLQYTNDDPNQRREYSGSRLILPHGLSIRSDCSPRSSSCGTTGGC